MFEVASGERLFFMGASVVGLVARSFFVMGVHGNVHGEFVLFLVRYVAARVSTCPPSPLRFRGAAMFAEQFGGSVW